MYVVSTWYWNETLYWKENARIVNTDYIFIYYIIFPFIGILGISLNMLSYYTLNSLVNTANVIFQYIAIADTMSLITTYSLAMARLFVNKKQVAMFSILIITRAWCRFLSAWFLVALGFVRFVSIKNPILSYNELSVGRLRKMFLFFATVGLIYAANIIERMASVFSTTLRKGG